MINQATMTQSNKKPTIEEMNEAIARFDKIWERYKPIDPSTMTNNLWCSYLSERGELKYHTSWGWIMRVWVKFRSIGLDDPEYHDWCGALGWYLYCASTPTTFHERLYYAIKWYNEQKQANEAKHE